MKSSLNGADPAAQTGGTWPREPRVLACETVALPPDFLAATDVLPPIVSRWWEGALQKLKLGVLARRSRMLRRSWIFFRQAPRYSVVVTLGDLEGLFFAALQRFRRGSRPVHVMYDCLWYGGGWFRRAWMRFCLRAVDRCIVWASIERQRYARVYGLSEEKFLFVPHHHTLKRFTFELGDEGYIFTGGNADRDFELFFEAVRDLPEQCVLATNRKGLLAGLRVPPNVKIVNASHADFRQLMARARVVVMPMRATLLHAGAQQTVLNAMMMNKPVILTDPEGGSDYIENGKTGMLVPYGNGPALQLAIRFLLDHPDDARAMGNLAHLTAAPLTTLHCNELIWADALGLVADKSHETLLRGKRKAEPAKAKKDSFGVKA